MTRYFPLDVQSEFTLGAIRIFRHTSNWHFDSFPQIITKYLRKIGKIIINHFVTYIYISSRGQGKNYVVNSIIGRVSSLIASGSKLSFHSLFLVLRGGFPKGVCPFLVKTPCIMKKFFSEGRFWPPNPLPWIRPW